VILNKPDHEKVEVSKTMRIYEGWLKEGEGFKKYNYFWKLEDIYVGLR